MLKKKKLGIKGLIIIILLLIALFLSLIGFITDFLWFKELGYVSVFLKKLVTQLEIGIPTFILITLLAYIYLKFLKKGYFKKVVSTEQTNHKRLNLISWGMAVVFAALVTFVSVTQLWFEILKFTNSTGFDISDPLFHLDVSFYVFKLAFIKEINQILIGVIIAFAILTLLYYVVLLSMHTPQMFEEKQEPFEEERFDGSFAGDAGQRAGSKAGFDNVSDLFGKFGEVFTGRKRPINSAPKKKKQFDDKNFMQLVSIAEKQLIIVGVLFFLMVGVNFFLKQFDLLYGHTGGTVYGANFTDVNITLWVYRIIMALSVVAAVAFASGVMKRKFKRVVTVPVLMIAVGLLGTGAGMLVQNFVVSPDEINKESKYLEHNIEYTQHAYDLNDVTVKPFAASNDLTSEDISNNVETISNIRINDYEPAEKFYNQTQSIRAYYTFHDVDVDRYMVNGEYTQTFQSAREIDEEKISEAWLNKHLKYTHGYGITLSRVDKVTASGQPDMLIDSIPPVSEVGEIQITRPEIYFGEKTNNYVLLNTNEEEFDYPEGNNNKYSTYEGTAGIKLNLLNKTMFSIRERSLKLLVSSNITSDSKIVINRNIEQRVREIMPYLDYDSDPYIVTADGKLYWMLDAYTTSTRYPYSEPFESTSGTNYIRNSVKVVIDAYNGTTNYYLVDDKDPIANTYKEIYPKLFKDFEEMPESLQAHIRYPNVLFNIQANIYKKYHMTDVKVFYQKEDMWDIADEIYDTEETPMTPNYYIMKLPGEQSAEFVNSIPYTPKDKKNMTGLLVARNDGANYGQLVLYQLPKSKIIYGPMQIEAQIDQNTEISKEFSLWDSAGSKYSRGNMFVIPIEDSLLYVEPIYLEAKNSSIPEVKRVIVAYDEQIAYEPTLAEALNSLFGEGSAKESPGSSDAQQAEGDQQGGDKSLSQTELAQKAQEAFNNAEKAQKDGDWAKYGEYLDELQKYLNQLAPPAKEPEVEQE
ncbi:MAG: UPF0182 family protein [Firmicutes bacterium]|nr:UPF0182 family protein [Bacillota bacterium]